MTWTCDRLSLLALVLAGTLRVAVAGETLPPPTYPTLALAAAFARAEAEDTNAALILFIARNPVSDEADEARRRLGARRGLDALPYPGADGAILEAFDRARLAKSPQALANFAARYRESHPLGVEALHPVWQHAE